MFYHVSNRSFEFGSNFQPTKPDQKIVDGCVKDGVIDGVVHVAVSVVVLKRKLKLIFLNSLLNSTFHLVWIGRNQLKSVLCLQALELCVVGFELICRRLSELNNFKRIILVLIHLQFSTDVIMFFPNLFSLNTQFQMYKIS